MRPVTDDVAVADQYRRFAQHECGSSPVYAALAQACADDASLMARLAARPREQRQPNLVFGCLRLLGAPVEDPPAALRFAGVHWDRIADLLATRRTQTNELARCASFLPASSLVPGPIALIELGASAGLCLAPDRWNYRYRGDVVQDLPAVTGEGAVTVDCTVTLARGARWPGVRIPDVRWRAGLDLHPLDPTVDGTREWLTALVWPEHEERRRRLVAGLDALRDSPPVVVAGDIVTGLARMLATAPAGLTVVVQHSAVLAYLDDDARAAVLRTIAQAGRPVRRVGQEGARVVPGLTSPLVDLADAQSRFVLSLDDAVLGVCAPHGGQLLWAGPGD